MVSEMLEVFDVNKDRDEISIFSTSQKSIFKEKDYVDKEYSMLKEEIVRNYNEQKNLSRFGITIFVTIIGVFFANYNIITPYIALLPLIVEGMISLKLRANQRVIARAIAYMIVNLESPNRLYWETILFTIRKKKISPVVVSKRNDKKKNNFLFLLENEECVFISFICWLLFIWSSLDKIALQKNMLLVDLFKNINSIISVESITALITTIFSFAWIIFIHKVSTNYSIANLSYVDYYISQFKLINEYLEQSIINENISK